MRNSLNIRALKLFIVCLLCFLYGEAQKKSYKDSLQQYRQNYIATHEVVGKDDRKYLQFYDVDKSYRVIANLKKIEDKEGFYMSTSSGKKSYYYKYGLLDFRLHDSLVRVYVYQSKALLQKEELKKYLFVPFGDATSGFASYGGGRNMDLSISDIRNNRVTLDFNKAYNPYCAYITGYNCPVPPVENLLKISIPAGEKVYGKKIH